MFKDHLGWSVLCYFRQDLAMQPRLAVNLESPI